VKAVTTAELIELNRRYADVQSHHNGQSRQLPKHGETGNTGETAAPIRSRRASTFDVRAAQFTFGSRVQLGALNLLVGIGGLNKSTLTARIAADATNGRLGGDLTDPATVLLASAEDGTEDVTVPRLIAAGADLARVVIPEEPIVLPDDLHRLAALVQNEDVSVAVIDPLVAFLDGGTDSHNDASVRQALGALKPMSEEHALTTIAVMHLNKTRARDTYTRISGSAGFFNAARSVMAMTADPRTPDDELSRVLWHEKANAGPKATPQAFTVVPVGVTATDGATVPTIRLDLGDLLDGLAIGDALDPGPGEERHERADAKDWLRNRLSAGAMSAQQLYDQAQRDGFAKRTMQRAIRDLGCTKGPDGFGGPWVVSLPEDDS
jgi:hypothetical protein